MRIRPSWLILVASVAGLAACTVTSEEDKPDSGTGGSGTGGSAQGGSSGTAGLAGTAGANGGTAGSTAGSGGAANGACGDIPVTGKCDGNTLKSCLISDDKKEPEKVVSTDCGTTRTCKADAKGAKCEQIGECNAGDTSCQDKTTLLTCQGTGAAAKWTSTTCNAANSEQCMLGKPGTPASCVSVPGAGTGDKVHGKIRYQRRPVTTTGWGDIEEADASDVYVGFFDGDVMIGRALTGWNPDTNEFTYDGQYWATLDKPLSDTTQIWVWAMAFNYDTGNPLMAVAKSTGTSLKGNATGATEYWAWGAATKDLASSATELKDFVVTEADGSGALNVYSWIDFGLQRTQAVGGQMSLIVYWSPQYLPECGACFCGTQCGGGQVKYGSGETDTDHYDSWIALGGPEGDQTHWASSVISHEFGHYVMANYSLSPGEGGPHYLGQASKPGLAYSEAWATAFGQSNVSGPVYVDQQEGTVFWVDISKYTYSNGNLEKPDPNGEIDQNLNENVGAGMIWKLWAYPPSSTPGTESVVVEDPDGQSVGSDKIFKILTYPKLVDGTLNRGYSKVDLVDFFDAALCSGNATDAQVKAVVDTTGFPYNPATKPACP